MAVNIAQDTYHFGVGGAGNIGALSTAQPQMRNSADVTDASQMAREVRYRKFSTGVGGRGNIVMARKNQNNANGDDDVAQLLRDTPIPAMSLSQRRFHTGIGGYANTYQPAAQEIGETRMSGDEMRKSGLAARKSSSTESSPRTSMADSMKDIVLGRRASKS